MISKSIMCISSVAISPFIAVAFVILLSLKLIQYMGCKNEQYS